MKTSINDNSEIYYKGLYWNDIPEVYKYICKNFTGDENKWWVEDFKERYAAQPFEHGLFINCGNGRIEREFIDKNIVKNADAFDYSTTLLEEAKKQRKNRSISYFQADANTIKFPKKKYDLVVNVAGLHHVQYINRFVYELGKSLKVNGVMVSFDYIGPQRNKYPAAQWHLVNKINDGLPASIRHDRLLYPYVPVMLEEDPTEAIHCELTLETIKRYFTMVEKHDTGGGIAYLLLTHNPKISNNKVSKEVVKILKLDQEYTRKRKIPILFSYFIAKPNQALLSDRQLFFHYQNKENVREKWAKTWGGTYRFQDFFRLILHKIYKIIKMKARTTHQ